MCAISAMQVLCVATQMVCIGTCCREAEQLMTFTSLRPFTYSQKFKNSFNLLYSLLIDSTFDYSHDVYCVNKSVLQGICINNIAWTAIFNL